MKPQQLLDHFGLDTQTALAAKLERPISTVADWFQQGRVPRAVQFELELLTRGGLKAERRRKVNGRAAAAG